MVIMIQPLGNIPLGRTLCVVLSSQKESSVFVPDPRSSFFNSLLPLLHPLLASVAPQSPRSDPGQLLTLQ